MKTLKMTLGDNTAYTFKTLPFSKVQAIGKKAQGDEKMRRFQELTDKEADEDEEKGGLSIEEMGELKELTPYAEEHEDESVEEMVRAVRLSISKEHDKFVHSDSKEENEKLDEELKDLMDMQDITTAFQFAMTGTIPKQEEIEIPENIIDLT